MSASQQRENVSRYGWRAWLWDRPYLVSPESDREHADFRVRDDSEQVVRAAPCPHGNASFGSKCRCGMWYVPDSEHNLETFCKGFVANGLPRPFVLTYVRAIGQVIEYPERRYAATLGGRSGHMVRVAEAKAEAIEILYPCAYVPLDGLSVPDRLPPLSPAPSAISNSPSVRPELLATALSLLTLGAVYFPDATSGRWMRQDCAPEARRLARYGMLAV